MFRHTFELGLPWDTDMATPLDLLFAVIEEIWTQHGAMSTPNSGLLTFLSNVSHVFPVDDHFLGCNQHEGSPYPGSVVEPQGTPMYDLEK